MKQTNHQAILSTQIKSKPVHYSIVQKQSNSGITFNQRLLVLYDYQCLAYISNPDAKLSTLNTDKAKLVIPLREINKIEVKRNILSLTYYSNSGKDSKKLIFKMKDNKMALEWEDILQSQIGGPSRKETKIEQQSAQKNRQQESPIKIQEKNKEHQINSSQNLMRITDKNNIQTFDNNLKTPQKAQNRIDKQQQKIGSGNSTIKKQIPIQIPYSSNKLEEEVGQKKQQIRDNTQLKQRQEKPLNLENKQSDYPPRQNILLHSKTAFNNLPTPPLPDYRKSQYPYHSFEITEIVSQIDSNKFINYFRSRPTDIDNPKYQLFIQYSKSKLIKLLTNKSELHNLLNKYKDQQIFEPPNPLIIKYQDLTIMLMLSQLKQVPILSTQNKHNFNNICSQQILKSQLQNLKNLDYIWQCIVKDSYETNNNTQYQLYQKFLIPMGCICEYGGYVAYISCNYDLKSLQYLQNNSIKEIDSSILFDRLSQITNISRDIFENNLSIKIIPTFSNQFIIVSAQHYLPRLGNKLIRKELFQNFYSNQQEKHPIYRTQLSLKQKQLYSNIHKQQLQKQINLLTQHLQNIDKYIMHPLQISSLFHNYGVNMSQLGKLSKKLNNSLIKSYIKSDICGRVCKIIIRKKMQQELFNNSPILVQNKHIKNILNLILGNNEDSNLFWKVLTLHSQLIFNEPLQKQQLHKGYFILSLQHYIGIKIKSKYTPDKIFNQQNYITSIQINCKIKQMKQNYIPITINKGNATYILNLMDIVGENQIVIPAYAQKILDFFNIKQSIKYINNKASKVNIPQKNNYDIRKLPIYLTHKQKELIMNYLANFIEPDTETLQIYSAQSGQLTLLSCRRLLIFTKWFIKFDQINKTSNNQQSLKPLIHLFNSLLPYHRNQQFQAYPFLSEIYDLISLYYLSQQQHYHAVHYAKLSLTNFLQVCGSNMHVKIAASYYQLAQCYLSCIGKVKTLEEIEFKQRKEKKNPQKNRKDQNLLSTPPFDVFSPIQQCLTASKKAKNILQSNLLIKTAEYATIESLLGKIHLLMNKDQESLKLLTNALQIIQQIDSKSFDYQIQDIIGTYQLIIRCCSNNWEYYINISKRLHQWLKNCLIKSKKYQSFENFHNNLTDILFQKFLRIILQGKLIFLLKSSQIRSKQAFQATIKLNEFIIQLCLSQQIIVRPNCIQYFRELFYQDKLDKILQQTLKKQTIQLTLQKLKKLPRATVEKNKQILGFITFIKNICYVFGQNYIGQVFLNCIYVM